MCLNALNIASVKNFRPLRSIETMETKTAIEMAGSMTALAAMLGITVSAVSQWGETIPEQREWQLRVLRPEWFRDEPLPPVRAGSKHADQATESGAA